MVIFDVLKTAAKVAQEAGKIELYGQILEVYEKLLEQQKRIDELETDNKRLRKESEVKGNLVSEGNVYWLENDGVKDGPFCTCCWDSEHKLLRLHRNSVSSKMRCPKCNIVAIEGQVQVFRPIDHRRNSAM